MTTSTESARPLPIVSDAAFEAHLASLRNCPAWLIDMKRGAWATYKSLPEPQRSDEPWRFATTDNLGLDAFTRPAADAVPAPPERPGVDCGGCLDFVDDRFAGGRPLDEALVRQGVLFMPLERAIREHPALVRAHLFERMPALGSEKYEALHVALFSTGVFLYVPAGVNVALPLAALHESATPGTAIFPHTLVVAGDNSSVTLFEVHRSRDAASRHFACAAADICALRWASIRHRIVQAWGADALAFHLNSATATQDASVSSIAVHVGGLHVRAEEHGRIVGRGGNVELHSLALAGGAQEIDQRTLQTHLAEDGHSDLLYKNVLLGGARSIFGGIIRVAPEAQRTDAYQTNRNLILSPEAEANSLPGLEILANDVKCSHGASSGQLDADQLYYFMARGIPRRKAEELMVFGFFEEVLGKIGSDAMADYVRELLQSRFAR
jgi:Fe-S cluster assembly protein SufD